MNPQRISAERNTAMENPSDTTTSKWVEINKLLAEKQTQYIEQISAINAYKKSIENINHEKQILNEQIEKQKLLDIQLKEKITSQVNEIDLLQKYIKASELNISQMKHATQEMENYISTEKAKHAETMKNRKEKVAALKEMLFSMQPEYPEYCAIREEYRNALEYNKTLKCELSAKRERNKQLHKKNLDDRNKQIVDFVQRVIQYQKDYQILKDYEKAQKEYHDITNKLLEALVDVDFKSSKISPAKDSQLYPSNNIVVAQEHPQPTASTISVKRHLRDVEGGNPDLNTIPKVMVQQNVVVHQLLEKASENKSLVSNVKKRKSDSNPNDVISQSLSANVTTEPEFHRFLLPNSSNAATFGFEAFTWQGTSHAEIENSADQDDFLDNGGDNFNFF